MAPDKRYPDPDDPRKPDDPTDLHARSWKGVFKRTGTEFLDDHCTDWAAALTYYGVLALFPGVIALVSLISLFGNPKSTTDALLKIVQDVGPSSAVDTMTQPLQQIMAQHQTAGVLLFAGLVGALWSASSYVSAFTRAMNAIYEVEEGRPFWKLRPLQLLITLGAVILVALVALSLVISGPLATSIGDTIGLGSVAQTLFAWLKWPILAIIVSTVISVLYYASPNVKQPKFQWFTLGGLVALLVWTLASAAFAFYVANFGNYNKTYGSLGAVIVFLIWLWLTNLAVLFGAEFNAELERGRELQAGMADAERTIQLPPREEKRKKPSDAEEKKRADGDAAQEKKRADADAPATR